DEYRSDEFRAILAALDPCRATQWRAWVALAICGFQGARQNAVLHLQPGDVELGHAEFTRDGPRWVMGTITWRAQWDKNGETRTDPLRLPAQLAIEIAMEWAERNAYAGPWLIPSVQRTKQGEQIYDQQSLWWALQAAEARAGI